MRLSGPTCRQAPVSGPEPRVRKRTIRLTALQGALLQVPGENAGGGHKSLCLASLVLQVETSACNSMFLDAVSCLH